MRILFIVWENIMRERLGIMYLSAALKTFNYEVRLILLDNIGIKRLRMEIRRFKPEVIGYSVMSGEHINLVNLNKILKKEFNFFSVFGGPHPTFSPDFINEEDVDAICLGEGDMAFPEFCRRIAEKENYWQTPNFWVKYRGEIIKNTIFQLVEKLDILSFPDRSLMYEADRKLYNEGRKLFLASRGCPYRCTYCFNNKYNQIYDNKGSIVRYRSPENIITEIYAVRERYPLRVVGLVDDNFLGKPREWLEQFSRLYKERINLPLSINLRADFVREEIISLLKDAGLDSAWMGVECGDQDISNTVLQRNLTNQQILNAAKIIKKYRIKLFTQNLLGLPLADSYNVDLRTLDFNIKIKPDFAWSSILYPYRGTLIEEYAHKQGFLLNKPPFLETNKRSTIFNFPEKEKRKINNLHKLFGIIVRFPHLRKFTDFICALPLGSLYVALFYLWYGYNIKLKLSPFSSFRKEIGNYVSLWWRFIRKS